MTTTTTRPVFHTLALGAALALLGATAAMARPAEPALAEAQARYQKEMASCSNGSSNQDKATCQREARNALAEFKRGQLDNGDARFRKNARQRCDALQGDDRAACLSRARGEGAVSGSVAGGGLLRESVTVVPASPVPQPAKP